MITDERIMRVHTLLRMALNDDLSIAETAKRVKQLFGADWGLTRAELDQIIDHRVRLLQDERRRLDLQAATLLQVRDQAVGSSHA